MALHLEKSKMVDGHVSGIKGDEETTVKEDILWMVTKAENYNELGDKVRVKQLLNSIRLLVKNNMENI